MKIEFWVQIFDEAVSIRVKTLGNSMNLFVSSITMRK